MEPEKVCHDKVVIVRVGDESEQKFQNKPVCCLGGVKVRATWQPADSWRTVGGAMILRAGVAEMGSGGGGADGCHMAITSSQRYHVQHIANDIMYNISA